MFSSLKSLKCQSGGDDSSPSPPPTNNPKLVRRISRWKMESPPPEPVSLPSDEMPISRTAVATVNIVREEGSLGITLRGGMHSDHHLSKHVVITHIKPSGPAHREGTIKAGDRLIAVNGVSLKGSTLAEAQTILKQQTPVMALTIEYDIKVMESSARRNGPIIVEIDRNKDEDLGLTLHQTNDGVFIEHIKRASISERCGALKEGDELLAVNKHKIDATSELNIEQVVRMLEAPHRLQLLILPTPAWTFADCNNTRGKFEERLSPTGCGWYGTSAVTHSEKLHTTLVSDQTGFGLEFCDSPQGTVIAAIQPDSPAERCGCLYAGDRVLAVNHRSVALDMLTAHDAADIIANSPAGRLILHTEFDVIDTIVPASGVFNVRLIKRGASGLGLTIAAAKENEFTVCEVKKGSPAHRAGSLMPGDRLLAVNGTPLDQCTAQHIAHILQQPEQVIALKVERTEQPTDFKVDRKVTCTVELQRYGGPIGITIAGSEEPSQPITVSGLTPGGLAEQTGALLVGDEILAINEHSLLDEPLSTAHTLLQTSPDLVCLRISRCIAPNGRALNMSPLQPSSVDSAVESWASSHLDLTSSPEHCRPSTGERTNIKLVDWSDSEKYQPSQLLDEITNDNLNIQRELEMLSLEINKQTLNDQWESGTSRTDQSESAKNNGYVQMTSQDKGEEGIERQSVSTADNFPMSNLTEVRKWPYLNGSQPSLRSEFKSHTLLTVDLLKDPVYEDFGFSVSDGLYERGVYINRIRQGGPADLSHRVCPFDRILQVNETCTQDFDCCLTVPLIASSGEKLKLLVARPGYPDAIRAYSEQNLVDNAQNNVFSYLTSSRSVNKIVV